MAADRADVVILSVPPYYVGDTVVEAVADSLDAETVLVTPGRSACRATKMVCYHHHVGGQRHRARRRAGPDEVPVVGAFHNLAADALSNLDNDLGLDTLVVADDSDAAATVLSIANEIDGLRALEAGPLANAAEVESVTPLVINIAKYNEEMHDVGVKWLWTASAEATRERSRPASFRSASSRSSAYEE